MIFGQNVKYLYGQVYKDKFSTPTKAYKIDPLPVSCNECPAKLVEDKLEIFFSGPIFNTYVTSTEDKVCVLKSYDDKVTVIKKILDKNILYTVKIVKETDKIREVELFGFDEIFPGYKTKGTVEIKDDVPIISTPKLNGKIILQNNTTKPETDCILYMIDNNNYHFVEINNPVERCTVKVVKDLKNNKIVENMHIKGILINCPGNKEEYSVYVKKVCLGTYVFIEDICEGKETVELIGKKNGGYEVKCKGFTGMCYDKKVNKIMKGTIYDIKGDTFKFKRDSDSEEPVKRTADFEEVEVTKKVEITSEDQIENDQFRAIEFIKRQIEVKNESFKNIVAIFNRHIKSINDKDFLCVFYLQYLNDNKRLDAEDVNEMIKVASPHFINKIVDTFSDKNILEIAYKKKKTKKAFSKLLDLADDKVKFIKENQEFLDYSITYVYKNMKNPRVIVEGFIDQSYNNWLVYLKQENGEYKRGLFRRMVSMKFKQGEIKNIFKMWLEFEENNHGNVEEVKSLAKEYVSKQESR